MVKQKRVISLILSVMMILSVMPAADISVIAQDDALSYLTYEINDGEVTITDCDQSISGDIVIPDTIEGYSVTIIGYGVFNSCTSLTSITIPDSVTTIGDGAFEYCTSLKNITIPDSVTEIGSFAFYDCTSLTSITIPDSVTTIGSGAFDDTAYYNNGTNWENGVLYIGNHLIEAKDNITDCEIKDGTLTIGGGAFADCTSLTSITIPNSVTTIGWCAFYCTSLTSITIPDSVTTIGEHSFGYVWNFNTEEPELMDGFTIYGETGSAAETYANWNNITFVAIGVDEPTTNEPTTEEPTTDVPVTEKPTTEEPNTSEPTTQEPTTNKPTITPPVGDEKTELIPKNDSAIVVDSANKQTTITDNSSVSAVLEQFENENVKILDSNGNELAGDKLVGTGCVIKCGENEYTVIVPCDVDGNGKISAADARAALRCSAKLNKLDGVYALAANVDNNEKITAADARKILRKSAKLED